jgi:hypothetical protein
VRLADCWRNGHEMHLKPGAGDLDFADMFRRIEAKGFRGHYMNAFGSLDDMLEGRDELVRLAAAAGVDCRQGSPSPALRERVASTASRVRVTATGTPSPSHRSAMGPSLSRSAGEGLFWGNLA